VVRRAIVFALWFAHHDEGGVGYDGKRKDVHGQTGALAAEMCMAQRKQIFQRVAAVMVAVITDFVQFLRRWSRDGHQRRTCLRGDHRTGLRVVGEVRDA